jgi:hypothetical protein
MRRQIRGRKRPPCGVQTPSRHLRGGRVRDKILILSRAGETSASTLPSEGVYALALLYASCFRLHFQRFLFGDGGFPGAEGGQEIVLQAGVVGGERDHVGDAFRRAGEARLGVGDAGF